MVATRLGPNTEDALHSADMHLKDCCPGYPIIFCTCKDKRELEVIYPEIMSVRHVAALAHVCRLPTNMTGRKSEAVMIRDSGFQFQIYGRPCSKEGPSSLVLLVVRMRFCRALHCLRCMLSATYRTKAL